MVSRLFEKSPYLITFENEHMGILRSRKNKKFSYTPRYYKGEGSPYEIKHKFDEFRTTVGSEGGLKNKFKNAWYDLSSSKRAGVNLRIVLIVCILVFLSLYIIDFDLSIFFQKL